MSCPDGFDPFGDRDAELLSHAEICGHCAEVLRVLGACGDVWRHGLANDGARAFYRERRISRARPPARTAMTTLVFAIVVAALSGYALARHANPRVEVAFDAKSSPSVPIVTSPETPRPIAPGPKIDADRETNATKAVELPVLNEAPRTESSRELWQRANTLLDAGDRAHAEQAFRQVMDLPIAEPGLRSRATFRWAELLLSRGDVLTPRAPLFRLVGSKDAALGFDAALLLERCAPEERTRIWDTYLEGTADPTLRARAMQHR